MTPEIEQAVKREAECVEVTLAMLRRLLTPASSLILLDEVGFHDGSGITATGDTVTIRGKVMEMVSDTPRVPFPSIRYCKVLEPMSGIEIENLPCPVNLTAKSMQKCIAEVTVKIISDRRLEISEGSNSSDG